MDNLLAEYRTLRIVGRGALWQTRECEDGLGRRVAVRNCLLSTPAPKRFLAALDDICARLAGTPARGLTHPLKWGFGAAGDAIRVDEWADGTWLPAHLRDRAPFAPVQALAVGEGIALCLSALHGVGLVHGSLHPGRVILDPDRPATGQARLLGATSLTLRRALWGPAEAGVGNLTYVAPERLRGEEVLGPTVDVWGFGRLLLALMASDAPGHHRPSAAGAAAGPEVGASSPGLGPGVPRPLAALIARMVESDPGRRPRTMDDVLDGLAEARAVVVRTTG